MNKKLIIFCAILFTSGFALLMYPFLANKWNEKNTTQAIDNYEDDIKDMDEEELDALKEAAKKYNEQLNQVISSNDEAKDNVSYTDINGENQVIGYIVIPKIDVNLTIYSGTDEKVLRTGVGHMEQTSYPLGGESTHCVLTGHRGLPSATLFTDLDKLEIGDEFYLHVLDEVLAYRVDMVEVIEPTQGEYLDIIEGEDYCTLATCTPYAINTHRLLVRGVRTEYIEKSEKETHSQMQSGSFKERVVDVWPWLLATMSVVFVVEITIFLLIIRRKRKDKRL